MLYLVIRETADPTGEPVLATGDPAVLRAAVAAISGRLGAALSDQADDDPSLAMEPGTLAEAP